MSKWGCKKCAANIPHDFNHGKSGYSYHGCRCEICVEATYEYNRKQLEKNRDQIYAQRRDAYRKDPDRWRRYNQRNRERNGEHQRVAKQERERTLRATPAFRAKRRRVSKRWERSIQPERYGPYEPYEDWIILGADPRYQTHKQIAAHLGRSVNQVKARRNKLRAGKGLNHNRDRTHCIHGHEFTEENTYVTKDGRRQCRQCLRDRQRSRVS